MARSWASRLHEDSPDEEVHELRILCKKLRYLLEFFGSLLDKKKLKSLVKKLKALQDCLGVFNDLSVQQENLLRYSREHPKASPLVHMAIGGMVSVLAQRQTEERYRVLDQVEKFLSPSISREFEALFRSVRKKRRS